jgi:glutamate dehydrogenase
MMGDMSLAEETEAGSGQSHEQLLELVERRAPEGEGPAVRAFAESYVRRLAADGTDGISPEDLAAEVLGVYRFSSERGRNPVAVRAFNPTKERDGYEPLGSVLETNTDDWPFLVDSVSAASPARTAGSPASATRATPSIASRSCTTTLRAGSTSSS